MNGRTYRHNLAAAHDLEPDRCELCEELLAKHVLRAYYDWGRETSTLVCDDCLDRLARQMREHQVEFRVSAYSG